MKNLVCFFTLLFCAITISAQQEQDTTFTINKSQDYKLLFSANKNDHIHLSLKAKGKGDIVYTISPYKDVKTATFKTLGKKANYWLQAPGKDVYQLIIKSSNNKDSKVSLKFKVDSFNKQAPEIAYKEVADTTYTAPIKTDTEVTKLKTISLQQDNFYLNSRSNDLLKGGKSRVLVPIALPKNTVSWYYVFSASREEQDIKNTIKSFGLASTLSNYIDTENSFSGAVENLNPPPGANICDIYLLNEENALLFKQKEDYVPYLFGSRENYKSGIVNVTDTTKSTFYLGLNNPDNIYGIHIGIEVICIVEQEKTIQQMLSKPIISINSVPYLVD
ncbi:MULTISPECIES: hypothetical protein [unclassified Cellulophaga]|uniref:hypothetical protein n=1 Tax=unclassified Cellulophaga TaxID=2634405 RepID=UPI0026E41BD1|nr:MULTISPECIES: hypothetical protein [unclassified Cellulophaga]MDO6490071.1 hypothetical protein [Cellulophaga sp. 2_MG-2023]MDO6494735.1 hypothetical protein [Cellulophaga sp. 3_MG-2023]